MVWLLNSQEMKNCKNTESFYLSILTIYTNDWSPFLTCLLLPCVYFFSARFLNMYRHRTTFYLFWQAGPLGLIFYGSGLACLLSWLGMENTCWHGSIRSEIFLQTKFIIFQGWPTKQTAFLPVQPLLLVPECYFA